jgi:hypothetical protein
MKWLIFTAASGWLVALLVVFQPSNWPQQRYLYPAGRWTLFEAENSPTILLDTMTGATWKSGICNKEGGLRSHADCWIEMTR